jgi:hypothetical protein
MHVVSMYLRMCVTEQWTAHDLMLQW